MPVPDRAAIREEVRRRLERDPHPGLPMPHLLDEGDPLRKVSCEEWEEYYQRRAWELAQDGGEDYDDDRHLPNLGQVEFVWRKVAGALGRYMEFEDVVHPDVGYLTDEERVWLRNRAKEAFLIVVDTFVSAGEARRIITYNRVFEALAFHYSDHYRRSAAKVVRDMRIDTAKCCRRDLVLNGVRINHLWQAVVSGWSAEKGPNPLFWLEAYDFGGRSVHLREGEHLEEFLETLYEDYCYKRPSMPGGIELRWLSEMLARQRGIRRRTRREMCAEVPYNVVEIGERSERILKLQQGACLVLDVVAFKEDYERAADEERKLERRLKKHGVDPHLSAQKRWIRVGAEGVRGGRGERRIREGREEVEVWSPRERHLFYRSIEKGLRKKKATLVPAEAVDGVLRDDPEKWQRHFDNYLGWAKKPGRRTARWPSSVRDVASAALATMEWRREVRELLRTYDRARQDVAQFRHVYSSPRRLGLTHEKVQSNFYRVVNRRYQAKHFWPTFVTSKARRWGEVEDEERTLESYRKRWFQGHDPETGETCELVSLDISASQTQILASLLSSEPLEQLAMGGEEKQSFKEYLAAKAWKRHKEPADEFKLKEVGDPYTGPDDSRLIELLKTLWMRVLYGSTARAVVREQYSNPETYGPGWSVKNAAMFLKFEEFSEVSKFLSACRRIAKVACERDPYAGVTFVDPIDGAKVRWNPVFRQKYELSGGDQKLILSLPGDYTFVDGKRTFVMAKPNKHGEYPVDLGKLKRMIAPCLVHMLDASFSSLVMEGLERRGVKDFAAIHDCWMVPARVDGGVKDGLAVLKEVVGEVGGAWYGTLGPVYECLVEYLGQDPKFGAFVRRIKAAWEDRVAKGYTPVFAFRAKG